MISSDIEKVNSTLPSGFSTWKAVGKNMLVLEYVLTTISFGEAPATFLFIRTLLQFAEDAEARFRLAAKKLRADFYVDNLLSGAGTRQEMRVHPDV